MNEIGFLRRSRKVSGYEIVSDRESENHRRILLRLRPRRDGIICIIAVSVGIFLCFSGNPLRIAGENADDFRNQLSGQSGSDDF